MNPDATSRERRSSFGRAIVHDGPIVLASSSPRRRALLELLGLAPEVVTPDVEETAEPGESPRDQALRLAMAKAGAVGDRFPDRLVIAADTVVVIDDRTLGKPGSPEEAASMLRSLAGRRHTVITGLAVVCGERVEADLEATDVRFRALTDGEISTYIESGEPFDKAGAYGAQGLGAAFIAGVDGCFYNVVGLPIVRMIELIRRLTRSE